MFIIIRHFTYPKMAMTTYKAYRPALNGMSLYTYSTQVTTSTTIQMSHYSRYFRARAQMPTKLSAVVKLSATGTVELV